jgi:phosphoribosylglycinamide formyltransferase-1
MAVPIAIMASGTGSNAQALIDSAARGELGARIACIVCDRPGAQVIERARAAEIDLICADASAIGRTAWEKLVVHELHARRVRLVVLAGYLRICGQAFLAAYQGSTINIHPSLLPAHRGMDAIGQALADGSRGTGITIHHVDAGIDTGPIIAQNCVPIHDGDTREALTERIQSVEHEVLPVVVRQLVRQRHGEWSEDPSPDLERKLICSVH